MKPAALPARNCQEDHMDVTSIVGGSQPQRNNNVERNAPSRIRAVVDTIVRTADRVLENQSTASRLQAREAGFRQAAANLARVNTLVQTAEGGVDQIRSDLRRLRNADDDESRRIRDNIDRAARETRFEGEPLLDGSRREVSLEETLSGTRESRDDVTLRLPDLSSRRLLGDGPARERVDEALRTVDDVGSELREFRKSVEVVAASIETVTANRQASQAELLDSDFERDSLRTIRENSKEAVGAQAKVPPELVKLVN
jgi:flagellin-like hook-associated protein FlgL